MASRSRRDDSAYEQLSALNNELVALQRELEKKRARLERLVELKNQFLAMVSHDLRKPIGAVISYTEFLLEDLGDSLGEEQRRFLDVIHTAGWRMRNLTDDFLDLALMESPRLELKLAPASLEKVVASAMDVIAPLASKHGISMEARLPDDLPLLVMDAAKVEQALLNLLGNAVDHCGEGTQVEVRADSDDTYMHLRVVDDGPGIPSDHHPTLFELGASTGRGKHTGERSTGLGLPIAKRIAVAHRGDLRVETVTPRGTRFILSIPLVPDGRP